MNFLEPISPFMTSSRSSCLSISKQAINIKMKFFACLIKASDINCFHKCFLLQALNASSSIFYQKQSCYDFSLIAKAPSSCLPLSWQKIHEYHFTVHCGCISIDQEIIIKKDLKDVSWPCRVANNRNTCNDFIVPDPLTKEGSLWACPQMCLTCFSPPGGCFHCRTFSSKDTEDFRVHLTS